jgi:Fe-S-cluster containining protein
MQQAMLPKAKKKKDQVCKKCTAPCCRNLAIAVTKPRCIHEKEVLKWYLHYDTVQIYIRNRRWYLLIKGTCIYLSKKNLCTIYDKRPEICRAHRADGCEMTGRWYDALLFSPGDLDALLKRERLKEARRRRRPA